MFYKIKTCTQIWDSGFRGKIDVDNPGDSAKRANLGRRGWLLSCKREARAKTLNSFEKN